MVYARVGGFLPSASQERGLSLQERTYTCIPSLCPSSSYIQYGEYDAAHTTNRSAIAVYCNIIIILMRILYHINCCFFCCCSAVGVVYACTFCLCLSPPSTSISRNRPLLATDQRMRTCLYNPCCTCTSIILVLLQLCHYTVSIDVG